jgi:hypothetical protein
VGDDDDAVDDDDVASDPVRNPSSLIGAVFETDLSSGSFIQPTGLGALLQSRLGGLVLLCDLRPGSDFDPTIRIRN